jgi:hypothetical protein
MYAGSRNYWEAYPLPQSQSLPTSENLLEGVAGEGSERRR